MKILILGNLGNKKTRSNGQTIKTLELVEYFKNQNDHILLHNTALWKKRNFLFRLFSLIIKFLKTDIIIILPAQNALQFFLPILNFLHNFKKIDMFYIVIGGWLGKFLKSKPKNLSYLKKYKAIYAETNVLIDELLLLGLDNLKILLNFRDLDIEMEKNSKNRFNGYPIKICTLSRVNENKGILDIITAINHINDKNQSAIFKLDIYGPIEDNFNDKLYKSLNENISYLGEIQQKQIKEVLENYFLLAFPTRYTTEGHPGTIIDAYMCGLPVIASKWNSATQFVSDKTGFIYEMYNVDELTNILENISKNTDLVENMRIDCLNESLKYDKKMVLKELYEDLYRKSQKT